ncbi:hypothetical protein NARC_90054 [Candidatus Nitrosocosmicus arcticus]|uniref:Uncharacterized protein n=2 Tax=Candidatus Nitrosocosmicus arcticus TaxID=2035267 RepID=A0A557SU75_9ARCH|nr:hypothetical protein NARC_90054 [Candidatus Nitrosocosmicus arcticus]
MVIICACIIKIVLIYMFEKHIVIMTGIKCKIISEPHQDRKAVFRQSSIKTPYIDGDDYENVQSIKMSYLCGNCDFILAKNIHSDQIAQLLSTNSKGLDIVLQCPECKEFNELNSDVHPS